MTGRTANSDATIAADVINLFAAADPADTPGFAALLDEFPTPSSRGNLRVILWRLADLLRTSASVTRPAGGRTLQEIIDTQDKIADRFEAMEPGTPRVPSPGERGGER